MTSWGQSPGEQEFVEKVKEPKYVVPQGMMVAATLAWPQEFIHLQRVFCRTVLEAVVKWLAEQESQEKPE